MKDKVGKLYTDDTDKAEIMTRQSFSRPLLAVLAGIEEATYPPKLDNISDTITEDEILEAIGKLANENTPGPDGNCLILASQNAIIPKALKNP